MLRIKSLFSDPVAQSTGSVVSRLNSSSSKHTAGGSHRATRQPSRLRPPVIAATLALLSFTHAPLGHAAQIDVISGGASVIGTECVNGKVVEVPSTSSIPYGPNQTLYVKTASSTKLTKNEATRWEASDQIKFYDMVTNSVLSQGQPIINYTNNGLFDPALFGRAGESSINIPQGQGRYQMRYISGAFTVLGTMYTATLDTFDLSYDCTPPVTATPPTAPVIDDVVAADQSALVSVQEPAGAGDITQYQYKVWPANSEGVLTGSPGTWQDTNDPSSPLLITHFKTGERLVNGTTYVTSIRAVNAAGAGGESGYSPPFTPSASAPPLPDAPTITSVSTGNGTATINFTAPNDNGVAITNYAYRLTREFDIDGDFVPLNPASTATPITLTGLNNGETYTVSIAAINANGEGPDSNEQSFTPGTQCEDVTNWTAPTDTLAYFCSVELTDYAFADFHILTTVSTDVCSAPANYLPTGDNNGQGGFCAQDGTTVRAIYDWDNGQLESYAKHQLTWLDSVQQIGSRSKESSNDTCGALGTTVAGRCANQLKVGEDAFRGMAGAGAGAGDFAITNLDTSNLDNIEHIFHDAAQFNQNVSTKSVTVNNVTYIAWDISGVDRINSAFWGATNFNNGGQPLYWETGNVFNMGWAFAESAFDQDISTQQVNIGGNFTAWDTSGVRFFDNMFNRATAFDQDLSGWVTSSGANMSNMFYGASSFNQDLSSWNVAAVNNNSNFDEGATAWCGTGFHNRGRPSDWKPSLAAGCPADVETFVSLEAPPSAVAGDELTYELSYWNSSSAPTDGNTLVLTLPTDVPLPPGADLSGGTVSGGTVTWNNVQVPGGTTSESGGKILVTGIVGSAVANGTVLTAEADITDDGNNTINDQATVTVTSEAILQVTLSADPYVLPGEEITYQVTVENVGKSDTTANMTLKWDAESGIVPASSTDARCNGTPLECTWSESLRAGEDKSRPITVKMAADATSKASVLATASASAPNAAESDQSAASAETEVAGSAALNLTLSSLPQKMVKPGGTVVYSLLLSNAGNDAARDTLVKLPIPAGVVATVPDGASCTGSPCEGATLEWNGLELEAGESSDPLTVTVTAPSSEGGLTLQASADGRSALTDLVVETISNEAVLQVAERPAIELTASFASNEFQPNGQLNLRFNYENVGTAASEPGVLRFNVPTHTVLKSWPQSASCDDALCSDGFAGEVTLPVPSLSENSAARSTDSADFTLQTLPEATSVTVNAALRPDEIGDFLPTVASTETALLRSEPALPVPTLPWAALLTLLGLISGLGYRRLRFA